tara:strand:- start:264 stop:587 length:324 start_codon:yes stop_codon:yes gene_type:complete
MNFSSGLAVTKNSTNKEDILKKAGKLVSDDREGTHGDARENHEQIAEFWNIFLDNKLKPMVAITCDDVAVMMALLKISRSTQGKFNVDDYIDAAAYMAIAGELKDEY